MARTIHDIGVARQIGAHSDSVEARPNPRWLMTSGTLGRQLASARSDNCWRPGSPS